MIAWEEWFVDSCPLRKLHDTSKCFKPKIQMGLLLYSSSSTSGLFDIAYHDSAEHTRLLEYLLLWRIRRNMR